MHPLIVGIEKDSGEKGAVEGKRGGTRMADLTKARPEEMESASGRGGIDPWSAPGGPASPVPGPGVKRAVPTPSQLRLLSLWPRCSSAGCWEGGTQRAMRSRGTPGERVGRSAAPRSGCGSSAHPGSHAPTPAPPTQVGKLHLILPSLLEAWPGPISKGAELRFFGISFRAART